MAEKIKRVKASTIPIATSIEGFNAFGIRKNADNTIDNVQVPMGLLQGNVGLTAFEVWNNENGGDKTYQDYIDFLREPAVDAGVYAQAQGDYAKAQGEAIQDDLALKADHGYESNPKTLKEVEDEKADHGYASIEVAKTLKQVEDNASVKIENLIVDGSFEDGIYSHTSSTIVNDVYRAGSKSILFSANNSAPYFSQDIICNATDKLYITTSFMLKSVTSYPPVFMLRMYDYGAFTNATVIQNLNQGQQVGVWYDYSFIVNGRSGGIKFTGGAMNTGVIDFYFDNIKCINLSSTFGAGNEPTKEEFELLLSTLGIDYFEGEITIPAQKVMQWQLALIRKNKNAIIALGGTII